MTPAPIARVRSCPGPTGSKRSRQGFDKLVRNNIVLTTAQTLGVDLTLQVGQQNQTVTIEADAELTETQTSSVGQVVGHKYIDTLPLPNRSANSLVSLAPGVVMIDPGQGRGELPDLLGRRRPGTQPEFQPRWRQHRQCVGLTRPQQVASLPLDALEEFRIISNNYAAEYGHSTGGIVALSTRSGTNQYHGSLFEYLRNDALDARNFFAATKPPLHLNQFGAAFGGPIRKDKTHFFASWEETRQSAGSAVFSTVPTAGTAVGRLLGDLEPDLRSVHARERREAAFSRQQDPGEPDGSGGARGELLLAAAKPGGGRTAPITSWRTAGPT